MAFKARFKKLAESPIDEQAEFFSKRFVFSLGDDYKTVSTLRDKFKDACAGQKNEALKHELDGGAAAVFLEKNGKHRTAIQRNQELADIDMDKNGKTSFIEYMLLHFKVMILKEYYKRKGTEPDVDLSNDGVGLLGVGDIMIEELFSPPAGLDPDLEKMMAEFSLEHTKREQQIADLEAVVAQGGVKGMAAKNQLAALKAQDTSAMNALEAKIASAIKKAQKKTEEELAARLAADKAAEEQKNLDLKGGLKDKQAAFQGSSVPAPKT